MTNLLPILPAGLDENVVLKNSKNELELSLF
jgi:hypothetical protein